MILVLMIDALALLSLTWLGLRKGFEAALPLAAFFLILLPEESKIHIFGLFDITSQRFVTLVLIILSLVSKRPSHAPRRRLPLQGGIVLIALWWALSTINSIALTDSIKALLALLLDYLTIYVLFARHVSSVSTIKKIIFAVVAGIMLCSFFGTLEAYGNWSVVSLFPTEVHRFGSSGSLYLDDARGLRIQSTFGHPILFGSALAMAIPATLYLLSNTRQRGRKLLLWIALLLMFVCIFKTSSRGPWIALTFSLALFLLFGQKQIRRYIMIICLLAFIVLVVRPGVTETLWNDYASTVDDHSSQGQSYQYRYALYELVMQKLDESPARMVWGYGPQSFPYLHLSGTIDGRGMEFVSCDSSIAALWVETGYVGVALMLSFLFYVLLFTFRSFQKLRRPDDQLCLLFFASLSAFYFEMTNVAIFGWGQQTILLWVFIALAQVYPALARQERELPRAESFVLTIDPPALVGPRLWPENC